MLHVSPLRRDQVDSAYPLFRSALPWLKIGEWRRYAGALVAGTALPPLPGGIMVAVAPNGVLRGGFVYSVVARADDGLSPGGANLVVRYVAIPALGRGPVTDCLARVMQSVARAGGCKSVVVTLPRGAEWERTRFAQSGFEVCVNGFPGPLAPPHRTGRAESDDA